jgi:hypothetical protein
LADQISLEGKLSTWQRKSDTGVVKIRHSCASCGNIIYGTADNMAGLWLLQAGTLDDTSAIHPELFTASAGRHLFNRWKLPSKEGLSIYAKALSIYRHFAPKLIGIVFLPSAGNTS